MTPNEFQPGDFVLHTGQDEIGIVIRYTDTNEGRFFAFGCVCSVEG